MGGRLLAWAKAKSGRPRLRWEDPFCASWPDPVERKGGLLGRPKVVARELMRVDAGAVESPEPTAPT